MQVSPVKIGIFDSGIGGYSILAEIVKKLPSAEIEYISDDEYAPYGEKSDSEIIERSTLITQKLLDRGCSLIVVACNSATAVAIDSLRLTFPDVPFVGVEPYLNVLNHTELFPGIGNIAVITTELTGKSRRFHLLKSKADPGNRIAHLTMPNLATIVEGIYSTGLTEKLRQELTRELAPLKKLNLSHLILGCTHYPLIADLIEKELGVTTISPGPFVANRVFNLVRAEAVGPDDK